MLNVIDIRNNIIKHHDEKIYDEIGMHTTCNEKYNDIIIFCQNARDCKQLIRVLRITHHLAG